MTDAMDFARNYFSVAEFSWVSFWIAAMFVLAAGLTSAEKKRQWGIVVLELLLLPVVSGMIVPCFNFSIKTYSLLLIVAVSISWQLHKYWWPEKEKAQTLRDLAENLMDRLDGENWDQEEKLRLHKEMSAAGWINLFYMTALWLIFEAYLFSPEIPANVMRKVWHLIAILVIIAAVKPTIFLEGWKFTKRNMMLTAGSTVLLLTATLLVSWIKLSMK